MSTDAAYPARFYDSLLGETASCLLRDRLVLAWPAIPNQRVLGIGHATPLLAAWHQTSRCVAVATPALGIATWPTDGRNLVCAAEDDGLPFADLSFDRVLLVHGLECAESAARLLRETWRVLRDDGRLMVVVANRRGMWAHADTTPFGQGRPYSTGQVARLLTTSMFRVEWRDTALFVPPITHPLAMRAAPLLERAGRRLVPGLAGVILTEAVKDCWSALPVTAPRRRVVMAEAA